MRRCKNTNCEVPIPSKVMFKGRSLKTSSRKYCLDCSPPYQFKFQGAPSKKERLLRVITEKQHLSERVRLLTARTNASVAQQSVS